MATFFDNPGWRVLFPELVVAEGNWKKRFFQRLLVVVTLGAVLLSA
jgi:hypothetical protein